MRILQECYTHAMESVLVYCPIDAGTMDCIIRGEEGSEMMPLLPSGLTITGDGRFSETKCGQGKTEGTVVTLLYQLLIGRPTDMDKPDLGAVNKMNSFVTSAVDKIRVALNCVDDY